MLERLTLLVASALFIKLALLLADVALTPAARLRLSLFRPYRGDPWPVGVQEDDDVRFHWRTAPAEASGAAPRSAPNADRGARGRLPDRAAAAVEPTIEDVAVGTVATKRPDRIEVHRA
jgi:hypothetical protein